MMKLNNIPYIDIGFLLLVVVSVLWMHDSVYLEWLASLSVPLLCLWAMSVGGKLLWRVKNRKIAVVLCCAALLIFMVRQETMQPVSQILQKSLVVMEFNVNVVNQETNRFINAVQESRPDLIAVIEPNQLWYDSVDAALKPIYPYSFYMPGVEPFSLAIFSKFPISAPHSLQLEKSGLAVLATEITYQGQDYALRIVHAFPPINQMALEQRNHELAELAAHVRAINGNVIVAGDLNTTPQSVYYREFLRASTLSGAEFSSVTTGTWPSSLIYKIAVRFWGINPVPDWLNSVLECFAKISVFHIQIDHVLTSRTLTSEPAMVLNEMGSDHLAIMTRITPRH